MEWSEGDWSSQGHPAPGCVTFEGGVETGPG